MKLFHRFLPSLALAIALLLGQAVSPRLSTVQAEELPPSPSSVVIGQPAAGVARPCISAESEPWIGMDGSKTIPLSVYDQNGKVTEAIVWSVTPNTFQIDSSSGLLSKTSAAAETATITASYSGINLTATLSVNRKMPILSDLATISASNFSYNGKPQGIVFQKAANAPDFQVLYGVSEQPPTDCGIYDVYFKSAANTTFISGNVKAGRLVISPLDLGTTLVLPEAPKVPAGSAKTLTLENQSVSFQSDPRNMRYTATLTYTFPDTTTPGQQNGTVAASLKISDSEKRNCKFPSAELLSRLPVIYTVTEVSPSGLAVKSAPAKTSYLAGQKLDLTGLVVEIINSDGTREAVAFDHLAAKGISALPQNGTTLGEGITAVQLSLGQLTAQTPLTVKKASLTLAVTLDSTIKNGGGDVTVTVKLTKNEQDATDALPVLSELQLQNDRGITPKTALNGNNGEYRAVYTLPNTNDTITFTVSFAGNSSYQPTNGSGKVTSRLIPTNASDMSKFLSELPSAADYAGKTPEQKAAVEADARLSQESLAKLSDTEKRRVDPSALLKLDNLLKAITSVTPSTTVTSDYSNSSSRIPQSGVTVVGAVVAVANVQPGDQLHFIVDQDRVNSGNRELLKVNLSLNISTRSASPLLSTPMDVILPLPSDFSPRSNMVLRHYKSGGGSEDLTPTIRGSKGSYTLSFRTNSFSAFTLYWKASTNTGGGGGGGNTNFDAYTIVSKAGTGGSISPSGNIRVDRGDDKTFTIRPNSGYRIAKVTVDGKQISLKNNQYTFSNVTVPYNIEATFEKIAPEASSTPPAVSSSASSSTNKPKPQQPASSSYQQASSEPPPVSLPEPSKPEESSSEELSSGPESSEESSSDTAVGTVSEPESGDMSDSDLTVAVVIIIVVVALSLTAVFFGIYLYRRREGGDE